MYGDSESDIKGTVKDIESIMKKQKDLKDINSLSSTYDEYTFTADQEKLSKQYDGFANLPSPDVPNVTVSFDNGEKGRQRA